MFEDMMTKHGSAIAVAASEDISQWPATESLKLIRAAVVELSQESFTRSLVKEAFNKNRVDIPEGGESIVSAFGGTA